MARFLLLLAALASFLHAAPAQRIVSTAPSITETLYALGLGDKVVGVTRFCRYPPEAQLKPKIGDFTAPNLELIASLKPDLVVVVKNPIRLAERLRSMRLNVIELNHDTIASVYESIRILGDATGTQPRAAELTSSIQKSLAEIRARTAALPKTRVAFVVGRSPSRLEGLVVVGGRESYLNEIFAVAGGANVFSDANAPYPAVTLEQMIARNPDVILDMGDMADTVGVTEEHKRGVVALWQKLPVLAAVKQKRVYAVASDIFVVPGPRVVDAARTFFELLHPPQGAQ